MWWIPLAMLLLKLADVIFNDGSDDDIDMDGDGNDG
jgi:hypothetical protein